MYAEAIPNHRLVNPGLSRVGFGVSLTVTKVTRCYPVAMETRF